MNKVFYISFLCFFLSLPQAYGQNFSTPWVENEYVKTRLITARTGVSKIEKASFYIAWEIEMKKEGWKTYWRSPGDAGKPTVFNWEGSRNVGNIGVFFPMPERFEIFDIQTFGYDGKLVLPINVEPLIPGVPVSLNARADFMACKEICVPFVANYSLTIPVLESEEAMVHTNFADTILSQVSKVPGEVGSLMGGALRITGHKLSGQIGQQRLSVSAMSDKLLTGADIIVEAASHYRFDVPQKRLQGNGNEILFVIPIGSTLKNADLRGEELTLTLMDGWGSAIETKITLE